MEFLDVPTSTCFLSDLYSVSIQLNTQTERSRKYLQFNLECVTVAIIF